MECGVRKYTLQTMQQKQKAISKENLTFISYKEKKQEVSQDPFQPHIILALVVFFAYSDPPPLARLVEYPEGSPNSFAKIQQISNLSFFLQKDVFLFL